jgi:outer membrane protein insertion porin family
MRTFTFYSVFSKIILIFVSTIFFLQAAPYLYGQKIITDIVIERTGETHKIVADDAIMQRLLYKKGDLFDADLSSAVINKLYSLGYFSQIKIEKEEDDDGVVLYIVVKQKKALDSYEIEGNNKVSTKKIVEKLELKNCPTVDDNDVAFFCSQIKKLYRAENYHNAQVEGKLTPSQTSDGLDLKITVIDGLPSSVREIHFEGVRSIPEWRLRSVLYTRELWLLGFADGSGKFNREMIEADKQNIEFTYQDFGYYNAQVIDFKTEYPDGVDGNIKLTFYIQEGDKYSVRYVMLPYDSEISKAEFLDAILIKEGGIYSRTDTMATVERLRGLLGKYGYSYADVYPIPKVNEETKTIDFTFAIEKNEKVHVRSIDITGNKITHDKVIRREICLEEGALIRTIEKDLSKRRVEALGFFEKNGVNWKTHKLSDGLVDLELSVIEAKTGNASLVGGLGSQEGKLGSGFNVGINVSKRNLFGRGWAAALNLQKGGPSSGQFGFNFYNPYFLDTNVEATFDSYYRRENYSQWAHTHTFPIEAVLGTNWTLGFRLPEVDRDLRCACNLGFESNNFPNYEIVKKEGESLLGGFLLDRRLKAGEIIWLGASFSKDTRNHPVYPSQGYRLVSTSKFATSVGSGDVSFAKLELLGSWYTPLMHDDALVLAVRGRIGFVDKLSATGSIPYRDLYHVGGQDTVRGFVTGGAGPVLLSPGEISERSNTPLGGRRLMLLNTELQFPMLSSYGMRGRFFYDAGCGWNTWMDDVPESAKKYIRRNEFNVRHSVGFGFSMTKPQSIKVDWGYKLDRDRKFKESEWEVSMSMNTPW